MTFKSFAPDPERDLPLIRQQAKAELQSEDIYTCRILLADNEVDRDLEQFSTAALSKMAELYPGKPGIRDHSWSSHEQIARVYRAEAEKTAKKNGVGEQLVELLADVYILRAGNEKLIADIEGGILKEVSVGVGCRAPVCTVCGQPRYMCEHIPGREYDGQKCWYRIDEVQDVFEFSFVAVPAQRGAGVRKSYDPHDPAEEFMRRLEAGEYDPDERMLALLSKAVREAAGRDERRRALIEENAKYLR